MAGNDDSFEEWLEGFTSSPYTSNQLKEIKARAENVSASEVKQLVKEIELLRSLLKPMLEYSENLESDHRSKASEKESKNQLLELVRFMLSGRE